MAVYPVYALSSSGRGWTNVTACREHINLSRQAACESMVLLKNEEEILPFPKGTKLAVFGKA